MSGWDTFMCYSGNEAYTHVSKEYSSYCRRLGGPPTEDHEDHGEDAPAEYMVHIDDLVEAISLMDLGGDAS
tara:strand:- start:2995 stop:3207 length:213 start_codon:yes stop_codon:yes gene_type:complete